MKRDTRTIPMGEGHSRYVTYLEDRQLKTGEDRHRRKMEFITEVLIDGHFAGILSCGPLPFETMSMRLDGNSWIIKLEAEDHD